MAHLSESTLHVSNIQQLHPNYKHCCGSLSPLQLILGSLQRGFVSVVPGCPKRTFIYTSLPQWSSNTTTLWYSMCCMTLRHSRVIGGYPFPFSSNTAKMVAWFVIEGSLILVICWYPSFFIQYNRSDAWIASFFLHSPAIGDLLRQCFAILGNS